MGKNTSLPKNMIYKPKKKRKKEIDIRRIPLIKIQITYFRLSSSKSRHFFIYQTYLANLLRKPLQFIAKHVHNGTVEAKIMLSNSDFVWQVLFELQFPKAIGSWKQWMFSFIDFWTSLTHIVHGCPTYSFQISIL